MTKIWSNKTIWTSIVSKEIKIYLEQVVTSGLTS